MFLNQILFVPIPILILPRSHIASMDSNPGWSADARPYAKASMPKGAFGRWRDGILWQWVGIWWFWLGWSDPSVTSGGIFGMVIKKRTVVSCMHCEWFDLHISAGALDHLRLICVICAAPLAVQVYHISHKSCFLNQYAIFQNVSKRVETCHCKLNYI